VARRAHTSTKSSKTTRLRVVSEDSVEVMAVVVASGGVASRGEEAAVEGLRGSAAQAWA